MSQLVKSEMRKRLGVIVKAVQTIQAASFSPAFNPSGYQKEMDDIRQYAALARLDFDSLKEEDKEDGVVE